ncbi:glycerophosphoryl diester phosphodiesterase membrane domain-containing protein [Erythrobacter rubeus]|uniref:Glycerophosphoryl diester phosphodiesterase membrane domain-containing protein n=1 Tax=Erythrobacter rubeus TaxID=2760803 RepID=A0ABR8KN85_9SPHN|nr:glycerophosphoryl diester phosphodiesterase membrane domain-containing protein [Erythrobacter rubeus]MBD2842094.1 glycerophosphoryl diester phosphodiesterase membrane domain-containing protein [Erythrobacter rubeus]
MNREATLSSLLDQTFTELSDSRRMVAIFLAIWIPITAVSGYFQGGRSDFDVGFGFGFQLTESLLAQGVLAVVAVIGAAIAGLLLSYWLYAALVGRTTAPGFGRFWPWLGIYILYLLGIMFGLVLLIVPGLILGVRWAMALPLVVGSRLPAMDTFGESWEKTRGRSWSIFGSFVILVIGVAVFNAIMGSLAVLLGGPGSIGGLLLLAIGDGVSAAIFTALPVAIYRLLHNNTDELAEVFE